MEADSIVGGMLVVDCDTEDVAMEFISVDEVSE